jgi:hypothetical protein
MIPETRTGAHLRVWLVGKDAFEQNGGLLGALGHHLNQRH